MLVSLIFVVITPSGSSTFKLIFGCGCHYQITIMVVFQADFIILLAWMDTTFAACKSLEHDSLWKMVHKCTHFVGNVLKLNLLMCFFSVGALICHQTSWKEDRVKKITGNKIFKVTIFIFTPAQSFNPCCDIFQFFCLRKGKLQWLKTWPKRIGQSSITAANHL